MELATKYIDELIDLRREAREQKNWKLSDEIRDVLDTKNVFVFDTSEGQVIYHRPRYTRKELVKKLKMEMNAIKRFDSWLFSQIQSSERNLIPNCQTY